MLLNVDIAAEELEPKYMRGYGEVPESVATELNGIMGELSGLVHRFDRYLSKGIGEDLEGSVGTLGASGNDLELLKKIEQTVRDRGLVEFRPSIAAILDRAEDKSFEIAVFGRVSSGKSSLLNAILETDALPVGVTPITAVPTRIIHAEESSAHGLVFGDPHEKARDFSFAGVRNRTAEPWKQRSTWPALSLRFPRRGWRAASRLSTRQGLGLWPRAEPRKLWPTFPNAISAWF